MGGSVGGFSMYKMVLASMVFLLGLNHLGWCEMTGERVPDTTVFHYEYLRDRSFLPQNSNTAEKSVQAEQSPVGDTIYLQPYPHYAGTAKLTQTGKAEWGLEGSITCEETVEMEIQFSSPSSSTLEMEFYYQTYPYAHYSWDQNPDGKAWCKTYTDPVEVDGAGEFSDGEFSIGCLIGHVKQMEVTGNYNDDQITGFGTITEHVKSGYYYTTYTREISFTLYRTNGDKKLPIRVSGVKVIDADGNALTEVGTNEVRQIDAEVGMKFQPIDNAGIVEFPQPYGDIIYGGGEVTVKSVYDTYMSRYSVCPVPPSGDYEVYSSFGVESNGTPKRMVNAFRGTAIECAEQEWNGTSVKLIKLVKYGTKAALYISYIAYPPAVPFITQLNNGASIFELASWVGKMGYGGNHPYNPPFEVNRGTYTTNDGLTITHESRGLIELTDDETTVYVYDGQFTLDSGDRKSVTVTTGLASTCSIGETPSDPISFNSDSVEKMVEYQRFISIL